MLSFCLLLHYFSAVARRGVELLFFICNVLSSGVFFFFFLCVFVYIPVMLYAHVSTAMTYSATMGDIVFT